MKRVLILFFMLTMTVIVKSQTSIDIFYSVKQDSDTLTATAELLKIQLGRSVSLSFVKKDELSFKDKGILLSAEPGNWPKFSAELKKLGPEGIIVKSAEKGIAIIGNSQLAVQHGIFVYLEKLGYRFYFPHPDWHIIPAIEAKNLFPKIKFSGEPSFNHRRLWYSYGTGSPKAEQDYNLWFKANRLGTSVYANFGHAYDDIVYRNQEVFKKHPEWFFPKLINPNIIPPDPKFNLADESLIQFIINDALKRIEEKKKKGDQSYKMISMMPSDGLGTCNTPACLKLGATITDRVFYLINRVAKAVRVKYPDVMIGGMSYGEYAAAPTAKLEANTYVNIATAFNNSKFTTEELIKTWSAKAGKTGIYDYLSLYNWDWDIPGQSQASRYNEYVNTLKKFYKNGVRGFEAETNVGINKGLGHYLIARLLWDVNDNDKNQINEFFQLSFGNISEGIKKLWEEWANYSFKSVRENDLARWIDMVKAAEGKITDIKIKKKLFHIKAYLYYITLYNNFQKDNSEAKRIALLSYCYRMVEYASFAGYPALWDLGNGTGLPGFSYNDPKAKYKLNNTPITENEIVQNLGVARAKMKLTTGLKQFPLTESFIVAPGAEKWSGTAGDGSQDQNAFWMGSDFVIKISKQGNENYIDFSGGYPGSSEKPIKVSITKYNSTGKPEGNNLLYYEYKTIGVTERISLSVLPAGYYIVHIEDPAKIYRPKFPAAIFYSLIVAPGQSLKGTYANHLFIYVPKGVTKFSVLKYEAKFQTPTGRIVDLANKIVEEVEVAVKPGEEGLWKLTFFSSELAFEGLPLLMGPVAGRMLIPHNVK